MIASRKSKLKVVYGSAPEHEAEWLFEMHLVCFYKIDSLD